MKENVFFAGTHYSLLFYWLKFGFDNTTIVLNHDIDESVKQWLSKNYDTVIYKNRFRNVYIVNLIYRFFFGVRLKLKIFLCGRSVKIFGGDHLPSFLAFRKNEYSIIEDGIANYTRNENENENFSYFEKYSRLKESLYRSRVFGRAENANQIYLSGILDVPDDIVSKVELVDVRKLWHELSHFEKKEIYRCFSVCDETLNLFEKYKIILLTQPLEELPGITELDKVGIYHDFISSYNYDDILLKTHPREMTNYRSYFPNIKVVDESFPMEVISMQNVRFDKVLTICSTAALYLNTVELVWVGDNCNDKLYDIFKGKINIENLKKQ
ncbi:glycosyltransferase family 52 [Vibrio breoganii]|uniref:glycosyltransferase family 52 n=1 Tax=Vibrio breoganii TaxID=553239 RepID=UPI000C84E2B3|nr:glycosyltransferase family 52 [Vibrio breoganii]PMK67122.1 hypothetical protein BCT94_17635 [Vibrio breoganii]